MKNEWTHKTRTFHKHGILANLNCRLTMEEFELSLLIDLKLGSVDHK